MKQYNKHKILAIFGIIFAIFCLSLGLIKVMNLIGAIGLFFFNLAIAFFNLGYYFRTKNYGV